MLQVDVELIEIECNSCKIIWNMISTFLNKVWVLNLKNFKITQKNYTLRYRIFGFDLVRSSSIEINFLAWILAITTVFLWQLCKISCILQNHILSKVFQSSIVYF